MKVKDSTLNFVFDTGAEGSLIYDTCNLGLKTNPKDTVMMRYTFYDSLFPLAVRTYPEKVSFGDISVPRKIKFCVSQVPLIDFNIIGSDIIQQLFWLFNFDSMKFTVSDRPIRINDLSEWIQIPYKMWNNNMYVHVIINDTINMGYYVFDSGFHKMKPGRYPHILYHIVSHPSQSMKIGPKLMSAGFREIGVYKNGLEENYGGYVYIYDSISVFGYKSDNCAVSMIRHDLPKRIGKYLLTLDYATQFHEMYLDTRKKIIYLKP